MLWFRRPFGFLVLLNTSRRIYFKSESVSCSNTEIYDARGYINYSVHSIGETFWGHHIDENGMGGEMRGNGRVQTTRQNVSVGILKKENSHGGCHTGENICNAKFSKNSDRNVKSGALAVMDSHAYKVYFADKFFAERKNPMRESRVTKKNEEYFNCLKRIWMLAVDDQEVFIEIKEDDSNEKLDDELVNTVGKIRRKLMDRGIIRSRRARNILEINLGLRLSCVNVGAVTNARDFVCLSADEKAAWLSLKFIQTYAWSKKRTPAVQAIRRVADIIEETNLPTNIIGVGTLKILPGFSCLNLGQLFLLGLHCSTADKDRICLGYDEDKSVIATSILLNDCWVDDAGVLLIVSGEDPDTIEDRIDADGDQTFSTNGASARNWGLLAAWRYEYPIRVIRSYRSRSRFAPEFGFRYDGLYRIIDMFADEAVAPSDIDILNAESLTTQGNISSGTSRSLDTVEVNADVGVKMEMDVKKNSGANSNGVTTDTSTSTTMCNDSDPAGNLNRLRVGDITRTEGLESQQKLPVRRIYKFLLAQIDPDVYTPAEKSGIQRVLHEFKDPIFDCDRRLRKLKRVAMRHHHIHSRIQSAFDHSFSKRILEVRTTETGPFALEISPFYFSSPGSKPTPVTIGRVVAQACQVFSQLMSHIVMKASFSVAPVDYFSDEQADLNSERLAATLKSPPRALIGSSVIRAINNANEAALHTSSRINETHKRNGDKRNTSRSEHLDENVPSWVAAEFLPAVLVVKSAELRLVPLSEDCKQHLVDDVLYRRPVKKSKNAKLRCDPLGVESRIRSKCEQIGEIKIVNLVETNDGSAVSTSNHTNEYKSSPDLLRAGSEDGRVDRDVTNLRKNCKTLENKCKPDGKQLIVGKTGLNFGEQLSEYYRKRKRIWTSFHHRKYIWIITETRILISRCLAHQFAFPFLPQSDSSGINVHLELCNPLPTTWCPWVDISQGVEVFKIPAFNNIDAEPPPTNFSYQRHNVVFSRIPRLQIMCLCRGCMPTDADTSSWERVHIENYCDAVRNPLTGELYCAGANQEFLNDFGEIAACSEHCLCNPKLCKNRYPENLRYRMGIMKTRHAGWELMALEPISKGSFIMQYVGEMVTRAVMDGRSNQNSRKGFHNYCMEVVSEEEDWRENWKSPCIDSLLVGNVSRFLNHCCEPNVFVQTIWRGPLLPIVGIFALCDIKIGDALTYEYGAGYEQIPCSCGAKTCRGLIGGNTRKPVGVKPNRRNS